MINDVPDGRGDSHIYIDQASRSLLLRKGAFWQTNDTSVAYDYSESGGP